MLTYNFLPFNFKLLGNKYLLVNEMGEFCFLSKFKFTEFIDKKKNGEKLKGRFCYQKKSEVLEYINNYQKNKHFLNSNTSLFILVLTNRCILNCIYCQASKKNCPNKKYDMSLATAKRAVDLIMQSPSKEITIEFQGGEPLLNFDVLKFVVCYSKKLKSRFKSRIEFNVVSNLVPLDEKKLEFLISNDVRICTSLDGNQELHNYNRPYPFGNSYKLLVKKIALLKKFKKKKGQLLNAIQTTTRKSLFLYKQIVDEYISLGFDSVFLRCLNPFGLAERKLGIIGYSPYEFLKFYRNALKHVIKLNFEGKLFIEATAQIYLQKILNNEKMHFMDLRSPCGAVIGQMAVNYDGSIYTCDEGRMLAETGDNNFYLGNVYQSNYSDLVKNDTTKMVCFASCTECFPRCYQCVYRPYCGVCPVINYSQERSIFKNNGFRCVIQTGILDTLFQYLKNNKKARQVFYKWVDK